MDRYVKRILIAGMQGCGKTFLSLKFVAIAHGNGKKVLILTPDDDEEKFHCFPEIKIHQIQTFTRVARLIVDVHDKKFYEKLSNPVTGIKDCLFIMDDGKSLMTGSQNPDLLDILRRARQRNIDAIFSCHGFTDVPPSFWRYFDELILFYTSDNPKNSFNSIPDIDEKIIYQERVNETVINTKNGYYCERIKLQMSVFDLLNA